MSKLIVTTAAVIALTAVSAPIQIGLDGVTFNLAFAQGMSRQAREKDQASAQGQGQSSGERGAPGSVGRENAATRIDDNITRQLNRSESTDDGPGPDLTGLSNALGRLTAINDGVSQGSGPINAFINAAPGMDVAKNWAAPESAVRSVSDELSSGGYEVMLLDEESDNLSGD